MSDTPPTTPLRVPRWWWAMMIVLLAIVIAATVIAELRGRTTGDDQLPAALAAATAHAQAMEVDVEQMQWTSSHEDGLIRIDFAPRSALAGPGLSVWVDPRGNRVVKVERPAAME